MAATGAWDSAPGRTGTISRFPSTRSTSRWPRQGCPRPLRGFPRACCTLRISPGPAPTTRTVSFRMSSSITGQNTAPVYNSSPSISSSPSSITVLWMSTRNHSRKVLISRVCGQVDSSSVHSASCSSNSHDGVFFDPFLNVFLELELGKQDGGAVRFGAGAPSASPCSHRRRAFWSSRCRAACRQRSRQCG